MNTCQCVGSMAIGGAAGAAVARRMAITELPQMVAGFHSLVGLAAVTTSIASYIAHPELMDPTHLTSTFLGAFIGAVTLTGVALSRSNLSSVCHLGHKGNACLLLRYQEHVLVLSC